MRHLVTAIVLSAFLTGTGLLAALSMSGTAFAQAQGEGGGCGVGGGSIEGCIVPGNGGRGVGGTIDGTGLGGGVGGPGIGCGSGGHDFVQNGNC